ncbi:MAG: leucine--tRNA ligase [Symbiobacteriaceae bacterium]|nr:leucine--tRNA ligase [Symbiobacteriaceae bacterium]
MSRYGVATDRKWQKRWEEEQIYAFRPERVSEKLYCLEMFSYPSAANLHLGHWWNYGLTDCWARMQRMQGKEVFRPMGFDAFGLPAENYAIRTGIHPRDSTLASIATMQVQLRQIGATYDWRYELSTCDASYYRWTQWLFLQLYKNGLAYRKDAPVNWCPSCQTVLANEQVHDGGCERCHTPVTKRNLTQWFFKITDYAEELVTTLDALDWPEKTKAMQKNWIGRSEGAFIDFPLADHPGFIRNFTTRADTLYGATYLVLAPEHPLVLTITTPTYREAVTQYIASTAQQSELDRVANVKEKTGVFTGAYALHPLTQEKIPIWIADYVLATYGTGSVMAVPGHDIRDFEFATIYHLPIPRVISAAHPDTPDNLPYIGDGILINSASFNGESSEEAKITVVARLQELGLGQATITYRLRDWLVSRQRYWGAPVPIIHCPHCGLVPVPEEDLPVELPYDVQFTPDGQSPLAKSPAFMETTCPTCGAAALRDPDTLDTFVDSSWYFLRYPDNRNQQAAWDPAWINQMLPVDRYVGGPEHACMHLLYARFITKALRDMGYLNFGEPFTSLFHQGIILGVDGQRMSKSRGNTIAPDGYVERYGADVLRLYLAFAFSYSDGGPWPVDADNKPSDEGIRGIYRFVQRLERWIDRLLELVPAPIPAGTPTPLASLRPAERELNFTLHQGIKTISRDLPLYQFNTSIAQIMILLTSLSRYEQESSAPNLPFLAQVTQEMLRLLAPLAPHLAEELWEELGHTTSIHNEAWPTWEEAALVLDEVEYGVQINGRIRAKLMQPRDASQEDIRLAALALPSLAAELAEGTVAKVVVVPGRLVNIVIT